MGSADHPREPVVYGCPVGGNSYTESLYAAAKRQGIEVMEGIWSGRWLLKHVRPGDTLHFHWPSFFYYHPRSRLRSMVALARFLVICTLVHWRGVHIAWTAHNLYPHDRAKREWMHRVARRFLVRIADRIFVHGPTAASIVREEFDVKDAAIRVIPHGNWIGQPYPNTVGRERARQELGLPQDAHVLLFIGLCKPYKGLERLIQVMPTLAPGAFLLVAGKFQSPDYQAAIVEQAARAGSQRVEVCPGYVADDRLQVFLNAADIVVLPYREILTSGAAVLALSFGKPVVAPRLGSLIDFVPQRCGVLYDADQPDGLREALETARRTPFCREAILEHISTFTWDDAAAALVDSPASQESKARGGAGPWSSGMQVTSLPEPGGGAISERLDQST